MADASFATSTPTRYIYVATSGSNAGDGSAGSPYATIQYAVDHATPGTAIMVQPGTYTENIKMPSTGGTVGAPIWLVSAGGPQAATIVAASNTLSAIKALGTDNIVIKDFAISGGLNGIQFSQSGNGFSNTVNNVLITGNTITGTVEDGIKVSQADNVTVSNNTIDHVGQEGVDFFAVNNSVVSHNEVSNAASSSAGIFAKGGSTNDQILNNYVHDVKADGIVAGGWSSIVYDASGKLTLWQPGYTGYEAKDITVSGNVVENVGKRAFSVLGGQNVNAYGNFFGTNPNYTFAISVENGSPQSPVPLTSSNVNIHDNVITPVKSQLSVAPSSSNVSFNNNSTGTLDSASGYISNAGPERGSSPLWGSTTPSPTTSSSTSPSVATDPTMGTGPLGGSIAPSPTIPSGSATIATTAPKITFDRGVTGTSGNDILVGGGGNTLFTGAGGHDTFAFRAGDGGNAIADFAADDVALLSGYNVKSFADLQAMMTQDGSDVVIDLGSGDSLTLQNTAVASLTASQFDLGTSTAGRAAAGTIVGTHRIYGGSKASILKGTDGNDYFSGKGAGDTMIGGKGDDLYFIQSAKDRIIELADGGTDSACVYTNNYTMEANVENATAKSSVATLITGNALSNQITGGLGDDTLAGGDGADVLNGLGGTNTLLGQDGDDTLMSVDPSGTGGFLDGGAGNDLAVIDRTKLSTSFSIDVRDPTTLAQATDGTKLINIEAFQIVGTAYADHLITGAGNDKLSGGAGDDVLAPGAGSNIIDGGTGKDTLLLSGSASDWTISFDAKTKTYAFTSLSGQGTDQVKNVEQVAFADAAYDLTTNAAGHFLGKPHPLAPQA